MFVIFFSRVGYRLPVQMRFPFLLCPSLSVKRWFLPEISSNWLHIHNTSLPFDRNSRGETKSGTALYQVLFHGLPRPPSIRPSSWLGLSPPPSHGTPAPSSTQTTISGARCCRHHDMCQHGAGVSNSLMAATTMGDGKEACHGRHHWDLLKWPGESPPPWSNPHEDLLDSTPNGNKP
jgi:hypothetical protein